MDKINATIYLGVDWRGVSESPPIKPNDVLRFCDLRNCILNDLDLSQVEFLGCRLNGTSFRGSNLQETQFIGCFSSQMEPPTNFQNCNLEEAFVADSHLNFITDQSVSDSWHWVSEVADAAYDTLSERNDVRYDAVSRLGVLGNIVVAPILACLLVDKEWEVRSISLKVLGELRLNHKKFPYRDQELMSWMFLCLGDESAFVREEATSLVKLISPSDDVLVTSLSRMTASSSEERLAGLRAATKLYRLDAQYSRLLDLTKLENLLFDEVPEVRSECLYFLGILDESSTIPWIVRAFSDPVASVRIDALLAVCSLSEPPPASDIIRLVDDPDEDVRLQVLNTLEELGNFDPKDIEVMLSDPSTEVRRMAQKLLEET